MIPRHLAPAAFSPGFGRQMRFIIGPRQSGKTFLSRAFLKRAGCGGLYFNWDEDPVYQRYRKDPEFYWRAASALRRRRPWVCFDEIHKVRRWKNILKGGFDRYEGRLRFLVTGSASLDVRRRTGDSLAGRFFSFRLNPLTLGEAMRFPAPRPAGSPGEWMEECLARTVASDRILDAMLEYGPFPEPFPRHSGSFLRRWSSDYLDRLVRGDMRDLTPLSDLHTLADLARLLPERTGSPLSVNSVVKDLRVNHATVKRHLELLGDFYLVFPVAPHARAIARAIRKERKYYFYDYSRVPASGARFENLVAVELKARCDLWTDSGAGRYELHFVRTRDGKETDFLVTRDAGPWALVECKMKDAPIPYHHRAHAAALGGIPIIQVCREPGVRIVEPGGTFRISAAFLF